MTTRQTRRPVSLRAAAYAASLVEQGFSPEVAARYARRRFGAKSL